MTLQPPLSRCPGPGLILITPKAGLPAHATSPSQQWAAEGFAVLDIKNNPDERLMQNLLGSAISRLRNLESCTFSHAGDNDIFVIVYEPPDQAFAMSRWIERLSVDGLAGVISYAPATSDFDYRSGVHLPHLLQISGPSTQWRDQRFEDCVEREVYPDVRSNYFVIPGHRDYDAEAAGLAHARAVAFLKKHVGGRIGDRDEE